LESSQGDVKSKLEIKSPDDDDDIKMSVSDDHAITVRLTEKERKSSGENEPRKRKLPENNETVLTSTKKFAVESKLNVGDSFLKLEVTVLDDNRQSSSFVGKVTQNASKSSMIVPDIRLQDYDQNKLDQSAGISTKTDHNDDDKTPVFLNPKTITNSILKRKTKPEPLILPPALNQFGFQSRLRSPCIRETCFGGTPPPYTPPPMLSPARSGSGLFWGAVKRRGGVFEAGRELRSSRLTFSSDKGQANVDRCSTYADWGEASQAAGVNRKSNVKEKATLKDNCPPTTDTLPHINIGRLYQADIPQFQADRSKASHVKEHEVLVYRPGDNVGLEEKHAADEISGWSDEDKSLFHQPIMKTDKDFSQISKLMRKKKLVKDCVCFYYFWKKAHADDYCLLKLLRRKREQDELYSLRTRAALGEQRPSVHGVHEINQKTNKSKRVLRSSTKSRAESTRREKYTREKTNGSTDPNKTRRNRQSITLSELSHGSAASGKAAATGGISQANGNGYAFPPDSRATELRIMLHKGSM